MNNKGYFSRRQSGSENNVGKNKNKPSQVPYFSKDWPWYFIKQAVGDDLFIIVTFIRNIRLSSFLGLPSKNKRDTLLLTLLTLTTMSNLS